MFGVGEKLGSERRETAIDQRWRGTSWEDPRSKTDRLQKLQSRRLSRFKSLQALALLKGFENAAESLTRVHLQLRNAV